MLANKSYFPSSVQVTVAMALYVPLANLLLFSVVENLTFTGVVAKVPVSSNDKG